MRYFLEQIGDERYCLRLDNETYDSGTGESMNPLLLTVEVHNFSGRYHLIEFVRRLNLEIEAREREMEERRERRERGRQEQGQEQGQGIAGGRR